MKYNLYIALIGLLPFLFSCESKQEENYFYPKTNTLAKKGIQPSVAIDDEGIVHATYGYEDSIFYKKSTDKGKTFSETQLVGTLKKLALGWGSGPQISVSKNYSVIVAPGEKGNLYSWSYNKQNNKWEGPSKINDYEKAAAESLVSTTFADESTLIALWIDTRKVGDELQKKEEKTKEGKKKHIPNGKLYTSVSNDGGMSWSENQLIYKSPTGSICECCKATIKSSKNGDVYVMFRNNISNNRNMHIMKSTDFGKTFQEAEMQGITSWELNGCAMDGGDIALNKSSQPIAIWQRKGKIYTSSSDNPEQLIGSGRTAKITTTDNGNYIAWNEGKKVMMSLPDNLEFVNLGEGKNLQLQSFTDNSAVLVFWNQDDEIKYSVFQESKI